MARTAFETWSRAKSSVMFSLCVIFTMLIITILGLVTGYLVSVGYRSINVNFFTQDPADSTLYKTNLNAASKDDLKSLPGLSQLDADAIIAHRPYGSMADLSRAEFSAEKIAALEPVATLEPPKGGMRAGIVGTLILVGLASLVGIPLGTLTGIYLAEYSSNSWLANPVRFVADVLAGVPSIVVGILGYVLLARTHYNGWAGSLALAFIMIPLVSRTTEEMLLLVPRSYREASVALGATKARTILKVVLPAAAGSLITGIMLSIARVAGETAPLLFTAANFDRLTFDLNQQFPSLTIQIYRAATVADIGQNGMARAGILVLLLLIFILNLMVRLTAKAVTRSKSGKK